MALRVCKGCNKVFTPQLTDQQLQDLWYEADFVERVEELKREWPGHMWIPHLNIPRQILCSKCISDPEIKISYGFGGEINVTRKKPKKKFDPTDPPPTTSHDF